LKQTEADANAKHDQHKTQFVISKLKDFMAKASLKSQELEQRHMQTPNYRNSFSANPENNTETLLKNKNCPINQAKLLQCAKIRGKV